MLLLLLLMLPLLLTLNMLVYAYLSAWMTGLFEQQILKQSNIESFIVCSKTSQVLKLMITPFDWKNLLSLLRVIILILWVQTRSYETPPIVN